MSTAQPIIKQPNLYWSVCYESITCYDVVFDMAFFIGMPLILSEKRNKTLRIGENVKNKKTKNKNKKKNKMKFIPLFFIRCFPYVIRIYTVRALLSFVVVGTSLFYPIIQIRVLLFYTYSSLYYWQAFTWTDLISKHQSQKTVIIQNNETKRVMTSNI